MNDHKLIITLGFIVIQVTLLHFLYRHKAFGDGLSFQNGKKAMSAKHHVVLRMMSRWSTENNVIWTANRAKQMQVSLYPTVYYSNPIILFLGSMYLFVSVGGHGSQVWRQSQMTGSSSVSWQIKMSLHWARVVGAIAHTAFVCVCWFVSVQNLDWIASIWE